MVYSLAVVVELLSSGKINNRLLCELATHPKFLRLMVDMEIFIDRLADMRVNQMNLILEATRQTLSLIHIWKRPRPPKCEPLHSPGKS